MRIVVIGCTNGQDPLLSVPDGDILICTGDMSTWVGTKEDIERFNIFIGRLPHKHKIVIFGDRDGFGETHEAEAISLLFNATCLCDQGIEIEGLKIYGAPWTPARLGKTNATRRAFCAPDDYLAHQWSKIPEGLDILITHCPPHLGGLYEQVKNKKPKLHVFSHGNGDRYPGAATKFVDVTMYDGCDKEKGKAVRIDGDYLARK